MKNFRHFLLFAIFSIILSTNFTFADDAPAKTPPPPAPPKPVVKVLNGFSVDNPQFTLRCYYDNLEDDNFHPEVAAKTMNFSNMKGKDYNSAYLAQKLHRILAAKGIIIKIKTVPIDPNYLDSSSMQQQYELSGELPEIYLQKYGNKWLFSSETVAQIDKLYDKIIPFDVYSIVDRLPQVFKTKFLGIALWQYISIVVLFVLVYFLVVLLKFVFKFLLKKFFKHIKREEIGNTYIVPIGLLLARLVGVLILLALVPVIELPTKVNLFIALILKVTIPCILMFIIFKIIDIASNVLQHVAQNSDSSLDHHIIPFIGKALKCIVLILIIFYILDILNINITPLLAGVSIGGLALALAAQDSVKHIFGSITIFGDHPFAVGDWITFAGGEGIVEEIGLRSTKIRTFEDTLISVPNGVIADAVVNNFGKRRLWRYSPVLGIDYGTQSEKIEAFITGIREIINKHPKSVEEKTGVYFISFSASSLDIQLVMYFDVNSLDESCRAREDVNFQFYKLAEELGISFAYPSQSIYMEDMSPKAKESEDEINSKLNKFTHLLKSEDFNNTDIGE